MRRRAANAKMAAKETEAWWLQYRNQGEGDKQREIAKLKARLKQEKARVKACAGAINESKRSIDEIGALVDDKKAARAQQRKFSGMEAGEQDDIVDEEEFRLMKRQREAKKQYRAAYEELASLRAGMEAASAWALQESSAPIAAGGGGAGGVGTLRRGA